MKEIFTDYAERIRDLASIVVTMAEPYRARSRELSSELDWFCCNLVLITTLLQYRFR